MRAKKNQKNVMEDENAPLSRSAKKRNCIALQKMGEKLSRLRPEERKQLNLPEDLAEALNMHDRMSDREAKRRQRQYIGRLMREMDVVEIGKALTQRRNEVHAQATLFQNAEKIRDALICARAEDLEKLIEKISFENDLSLNAANRTQLAELAVMAASERSGGKNCGAFRKLFREIAALLS